MEEVELRGNGHCVGRLLLETALLPRGASRPWRRNSTASFITWVGGFLTVAHVVPKRLLVACELTSKLGIPSEPCTADPIGLPSRGVGHIGYMGDLPFPQWVCVLPLGWPFAAGGQQ